MVKEWKEERRQWQVKAERHEAERKCWKAKGMSIWLKNGNRKKAMAKGEKMHG